MVSMRHRNRLAAAAATVGTALLLVAGSTAAATAGSAAGGSSAATATSRPLDHIFVIMLENHSKSSVIDDPNAPYLTSLAHRYGMAARYYGVTHPSMPNYIASIAGDNFGIQDDNDQNIVHLNRTNLVDQLEAHDISWDAYMENLPADKLASFGPSADAHLYAKKHNPFVLFDDIKNRPARMSHVRDYTQLKGDLNSAHAPQFAWISPNQCPDMHGGVYVTVRPGDGSPCPYGDTKDDPSDASLKRKADNFVYGAVTTITTSRGWTPNSAIVIVTDENDFTGNEETGGWESAAGCCDSPYVEAGDPRVSASWPGGTYGGGLIPAIVVTGNGPRGVVVTTPYNHYSLLTTIENNWGLGHLGHAGDRANGVVPMTPLFFGRH